MRYLFSYLPLHPQIPRRSQKEKEQRGNVYENKGLLWKMGEVSGNVIENTYSYTLEAGMLLKTNVVSV
jgi:hypothetical protein